MPDALAQALALPGLGWLVAATFVAGCVRGFAGFGTAMIFLPVAALVLPPTWTILTLIFFDIFGPLPILRRALRAGDPPDLARLLAGTLIGLPFGLGLLFAIAPEVFRYAVSAITLGMLVCLLGGLRYSGRLTPPLVYGTGAVAGLTGGAAGLPGPPVILVYLASTLPSQVVRANITVYLMGFDVLLLCGFAIGGRLEAVPIVLGLLLVVPNALGILAGWAIFRPGRERLYRGVAYAIIAVAALSGLPVWD